MENLLFEEKSARQLPDNCQTIAIQLDPGSTPGVPSGDRLWAPVGGGGAARQLPDNCQTIARQLLYNWTPGVPRE